VPITEDTLDDEVLICGSWSRHITLMWKDAVLPELISTFIWKLMGLM
jgi:hypothetical protein